MHNKKITIYCNTGFKNNNINIKYEKKIGITPNESIFRVLRN